MVVALIVAEDGGRQRARKAPKTCRRALTALPSHNTYYHHIIIMSDADSTPRMSIKDRIAALEKGKGGATPMPIGIGAPPAKPKPKENNALAGRIAALQLQSATDKESNEKNPDNRNNAGSSKVGKLKLPKEGVKIIMPGAGPPPSLLKKQKEREERKQQMIVEAQKEDLEQAGNTSTTTSSVSKTKLPPGAIKVMLPGCPPPLRNRGDGGDK